MDLRSLGLTLVRRWPVSLLVILLAVGGGVFAANRVGAAYPYTSSSMLVPPKSVIQQAQQGASYVPANPLLYLGGLTQARDALARSMSGQDTADAVKESYPGVDFDIVGDPTSPAPVLVVTTTSIHDDASRAAMGYLQDRLTSTLKQLQDRLAVAADNQITVLLLSSDQHSAAEHKKQIQSGGFAAAGIGVIGLLGIALVDGWLAGRRRNFSQLDPKTAKRD